MKTTPDSLREFLRDVQRSGWLIDYVIDGMAVGQCPRAGCGLRVNLRPGATIPQACAGSGTLADVPVGSYNGLLEFVIDRREALALTQLDLDNCIGLAPDHIAKIESGSRLPSVHTMFDMVSAVGYDIVLRPGGLPLRSLAVIAQTRARAAVKRRRYLEKRAVRASQSGT